MSDQTMEAEAVAEEAPDVNAGYAAHLEALRATYPEMQFTVMVRCMVPDSAPGANDRITGVFQMAGTTPAQAVEFLRNNLEAETYRRMQQTLAAAEEMKARLAGPRLILAQRPDPILPDPRPPFMLP